MSHACFLVFRIILKLPWLFPFLFYFIVDHVPFCFLRIPCCFFSCFVLFILIRWHLNIFMWASVLDFSSSFDLNNVY